MRYFYLALLFLASATLSSQSLQLTIQGGFTHPLNESSDMSTTQGANNFRKTGKFIAAGLRITKPKNDNIQGMLEMRIIQQPFNTNNFITQYNNGGPQDLFDLEADTWQTISLLVGAAVNKELSRTINLEMYMQIGGSQMESPTLYNVGLREDFTVPQVSQLALTAILGAGFNIKLAKDLIFHLGGDVMINHTLNYDPAIPYLYYPFKAADIPLNLKAGILIGF